MLLRETGLDANLKLVLDSWEIYNESKDPLQWCLRTAILRMKVPKKRARWEPRSYPSGMYVGSSTTSTLVKLLSHPS